MSTNAEIRRILEMVENGKVTSSEGARLLETARQVQDLKTCPYCAESIPIEPGLCPECGSNLADPVMCPSAGSGFMSLTGLGKFLVVYMLLVGGIELISSFKPGAFAGILLSALGLTAGILIIKGKTAGWGLGILWSALQIVTVIIHGRIINQQIFHLGINFHTNGQGLGINLVGIILLILFIRAKPAAN